MLRVICFIAIFLFEAYASPHLLDVIGTAEEASHLAAHHDVWKVRRYPSNATLRRILVRVVSDEESAAITGRFGGTRRAFRTTETAPNQEMFSTLPRIEARLRALERTYPNIAKVYQIGISQEDKRAVYAVKIGSSPGENDISLPEVVITGVHHAREWISAEVPMGIAEHICAVFNRNKRMRSILDVMEIWIIPVMNPDGFEYTFQEGFDANINDQKRLWRKNKRNGYGVDPNRNYDSLWGGGGSSGSIRDETYRGESPFSEAETQNIRDLVGWPQRNISAKNGWLNNPLGFLSFHSYGNLLMYPMGADYSHLPNEKFMQGILQDMSDLMFQTSRVRYAIQKSSEMYLADGDACDWFMQAHNNRPAFTVELRPDDNGCCEFALPGDQIASSVQEGIVSAVYFTEYLGRQGATGVSDWGQHVYDKNTVNTDMDSDRIVDYLQPYPNAQPTFFETSSRTKTFGVKIGGNNRNELAVQLRIATCAEVLLHQVVFGKVSGTYAEVYLQYPSQKVGPGAMDATYDRIVLCAKTYSDEFVLASVSDGAQNDTMSIDKGGGVAVVSFSLAMVTVVVALVFL